MSQRTRAVYEARTLEMLERVLDRHGNPMLSEVCPLSFGVEPQGQRPVGNRARMRIYDELPAQTTPILAEQSGDWTEMERSRMTETRYYYPDIVHSRFTIHRHKPGHIQFMDYDI